MPLLLKGKRTITMNKMKFLNFFSDKVINIVLSSFEEAGTILSNLYKKFNIETVVISDKSDLELITNRQEDSVCAYILNNLNLSNEEINIIFRVKKSSFLILLTSKNEYANDRYFIHQTLYEKQINELADNFLFKFLVRWKLRLKELFRELNGRDKLLLSFKPNERIKKVKTKNNKEFKFQKESFFLYSLIVIDLIAALAIGFQGGKNVRVESSVISINNAQRRKDNPYIAAETSGPNLTFEDLLEKQESDALFNKNISTYISLGKITIGYEGMEKPLIGLSINNYSGGETLNNIPVALYAKKQNLFLSSLEEPGIIITSALADYFVEKQVGVSTYSDLLGKLMLSNTGDHFKIVNIVYITDINPHTEIGEDYYRYHEHNIGVGKHLYNLHGEYAFFINLPNSYKTNPSFNFSVYPQGMALKKYVEKSFNLDEVEFIFKTQSADGKMEVDNQLDNIIALMKDYQDNPSLPTSLLFILSAALFALSIKLFIDLAKGANAKEKSLLLLPYFLYLIITLVVRLTSTHINLIAAFSNTAIIVTGVIFLIYLGIIVGIIFYNKYSKNNEKEI